MSLTMLKGMKHPKGIWVKFLNELESYHFDIMHRPGPAHINADAVSRATHLRPPTAGEEKASEEYVHKLAVIGNPILGFREEEEENDSEGEPAALAPMAGSTSALPPSVDSRAGQTRSSSPGTGDCVAHPQTRFLTDPPGGSTHTSLPPVEDMDWQPTLGNIHLSIGATSSDTGTTDQLTDQTSTTGAQREDVPPGEEPFDLEPKVIKRSLKITAPLTPELKCNYRCRMTL